MDDMRIQPRLGRAARTEEVGIDRCHIPARIQHNQAQNAHENDVRICIILVSMQLKRIALILTV